MAWVELKPIRQTKETGILGDIESHLWDGHPYKDADRVTWVHEGTHGVNSTLRNNANRGQTIRHNGFYLLDNWGVVLKEPPFKLADLANKIPQEMRGRNYQLYLVNQRKYWNDEPLYVLDELTAYLNGAKAGIELKLNQRANDSGRSAIEFLGYGAILASMVPADQKEELFSFLTFVSFELNSVVLADPTLRDAYDKVIKLLAEDIVTP